MYGFSDINKPLGVAMLVLGVIAMVVFFRWELKVESPVFDVRLFTQNITFTLSSFAALINYSATFAVGLLISYYLQYIKGPDPQSAGLILVAQPIIMVIVAPLAGRMSDKYDVRLLATSGMAIVTLGLFSFIFLNPGTSILTIVVSLAVLGLGFGLFSSPTPMSLWFLCRRGFMGWPRLRRVLCGS